MWQYLITYQLSIESSSKVTYMLFHKHEAPLIAQLVKNLPAMQETSVRFQSQEDLLEKGQATHPVFLGFPCGPAGKESTCNEGDLGLIPGLGRSPGDGKGYPRQCSGLENSMDCIGHGVTKSWKQLGNIHFSSLHSINMMVLDTSGQRELVSLSCHWCHFSSVASWDRPGFSTYSRLQHAYDVITGGFKVNKIYNLFFLLKTK